MRPKEGAKIELLREICQILSDLSISRFRFVRLVRFADFRDLKKNARPTDGRTDPRIEMRGRIL